MYKTRIYKLQETRCREFVEEHSDEWTYHPDDDRKAVSRSGETMSFARTPEGRVVGAFDPKNPPREKVRLLARAWVPNDHPTLFKIPVITNKKRKKLQSSSIEWCVRSERESRGLPSGYYTQKDLEKVSIQDLSTGKNYSSIFAAAKNLRTKPASIWACVNDTPLSNQAHHFRVVKYPKGIGTEVPSCKK